MEGKPDIFDRIMGLPGLRVLQPFYKKYKEGLLYLFFGACTFVVNIAVYALLTIAAGWNELVANVFAWVLAVLFAYVTNKIWVFCSRCTSGARLAGEIVRFFGGRLFTLVVEEALLFLFITWLQFPGMPVKVVAQIVVIVLNYVISKLFVFVAGHHN